MLLHAVPASVEREHMRCATRCVLHLGAREARTKALHRAARAVSLLQTQASGRGCC